MPQPAKRLKLTRKDIRQPDEFTTLTTQAATWARAHQSQLLMAVGVIAAVALVALLVARSRAARAEAAAVDFRAAQALFQARKYPEAAAAFATLADSASGTPFGRLAGLYRAHALGRQGDAAGAATAYGEYLATSPDPYLRQEALVGLGRAKETTGDASGALDAYTQADALDGPYKSDALLSAARLQEASGQPDAARQTYARLMEEAPDPELRSFLAAKMAAPAAAAHP